MMAKKTNKIFKFEVPLPNEGTDILGPRLSMLLRLLNDEDDAALVRLARSRWTDEEFEVRKNWAAGVEGASPDWIQGMPPPWGPLLRSEDVLGSFRALLRQMVDAWINTGLTCSGDYDNPSERSLEPIFMPLGFPKECKRACSPEIGHYFEQIDRLQPSYRVRNRYASLSAPPILSFTTGTLPNTRPDTAVNYALKVMAQLLACEDRFHIARCRGKCRRYFYRERISAAKLGIFCGSNCRNLETAAVKMKTIRRERTGRFVKTAAKKAKAIRSKLKKSGGYVFTATDKASMLEAVNNDPQLKKRGQVFTSRWITVHWEEIMKEMESRVVPSEIFRSEAPYCRCLAPNDVQQSGTRQVVFRPR